MQFRYRINTKALLVSALAVIPVLLLADVTGADPGLTGAPGEDARACTACHIGTALNGGSGSVKIIYPDGNTYTPGGPKQRIQVQVSDPAQRRWGFELSARVASSNARAGDLASADNTTQVRCGTRTCSATSVQYITHTQTGTRLGTTGGVTFQFDWTPPATDVGPVTLYAAGNAANGNNSESGDHIYTTKLQLTPAAASSNKPAIVSGGVVNGASFQQSIAPGAYVTIKGTNLAGTSRMWGGSDFQGTDLPTSLDNVSVTINNKPAYVEYVSPEQINVIAPPDTASGQVEVKVTANGQTSDAFIATLQDYAPAFFTFDGKYAAATHADSNLIGKPGLFPSAPNATTPAKPGETIVLYGTGFGPTSPAVATGQVTTQLASISSSLSVTVGGQPATVQFGGLVPPFAALYQFNVTLPDSLPSGDQPVVATVGGISSPASFVTVQ